MTSKRWFLYFHKEKMGKIKTLPLPLRYSYVLHYTQNLRQLSFETKNESILNSLYEQMKKWYPAISAMAEINHHCISNLNRDLFIIAKLSNTYAICL